MVRVHRLVATAFVPNPNCLPCVRHLDGNPGNNHADNLAWGSYKQNEHDKKRHGTWWLRMGGSVLNEEQVKEIRLRYEAGERQRDLATEFGVSRPTITRAINGSTWRTK